jgi:hypothetical protein
MSDDDEPWELKVDKVSQEFGLRCAELYSSNPYAEQRLVRAMDTLVTELWDRGFSQTEIRNALVQADAQLLKYAAGEEQNGDGTGLGLYGSGISRGTA